MAGIFRPGTRPRGLLLSAAAFAAVLLATQIVPGWAGRRPTPSAILFLGLVTGLLNALVAAGIILIYRTSRIINFAQATIGGAGAVFTYNLAISRVTRFPYLAAFVAGVLVAGLIGLAIELAFVRRFFNAPRLVLTVVTIALAPALSALSQFMRNLPIFGDADDRSLLEQVGLQPVPLPFRSFKFEVGDLPIPFGFEHVFSLVVSLLALAGLALFLRRSRAGVAVRAAAENAGRAMLLGINVKGLSTLVWTLTGILSGIGVILTATVGKSFAQVGASTPDAILGALAASVIARMRSFPVAVGSAVGLEIVRQAVDHTFPNQLPLFAVFLFLVILVGLLVQRRHIQRSEEGETSSWKATEELRPTPKEMLTVPGVRAGRRVLIPVGLAAVLLFPWATPTGATNQAGYVAIAAIAILSLVVLTGWTGQVSLGQFALVGVGAILGGAMTARMGISFWLAIPLVTAATAACSILIGLPALRIRGLFLAITTYAFAFAVERNLFEKAYFGWLLPDRVDRPALFLLDFEDERSMYYLTLFALVVCIVVVTTLRRSRPGRVLIGLRENESNVQSFGVNVVRTRLAAFALSGALCGFAGVLLAHHQRAVAATSFPAVESLNIFIFGVIGGIGSVSGALLGAVYLGLNRLFGGNPLLALVLGPGGLLLLLYISPGGLGALAYGLRDSVLRIVAQRRGMIVPSLFADMDPSALERRLAPLAEPIPNAGLAALPFHQRYRRTSELYASRGRPAERRRRALDERAIIGAAAEAIGAAGKMPGAAAEAAAPAKVAGA